MKNLRSYRTQLSAALFCIFSAPLFTQTAAAQTAPQLASDPTLLGPVYAARVTTAQSFLRIFDSSSKDETVTVNILNPTGGPILATWTGTVQANASRQIALSDIEAGATPHLQQSEIPNQYLVSVSANVPGFAQHVVWDVRAAALSVVSGCGARVVSAGRYAINVHTDLIAGYPSTVTVQNSSTADQTAVFDVYDAGTGARVGGYSVPVKAGATTSFTEAKFASDVGFVSLNQYQLNFAVAASFPGSVGHIVTSTATGLPENLTEMCVLPGTSRDGLPSPVLPATSYSYADAKVQMPAYYTDVNAPGSAAGTDNTPTTNPITDAGATLGRVLFYDKRLSVTNTVACASCHQQARGFGDTAKLSNGVAGLTARHTPGLSNPRFYQRGRFFWDERAATLEDQVLQPIQNPVEMGMTLDTLTTKLAATDFYPALFQAAFGSSAVTSDRISLALAQFVRSLSTYHAKYDQVLGGGPGAGGRVLTAQEQQGQALFGGGPNNPNAGRTVGCVRCHQTAAQVLDQPHNTGLDFVTTDVGAGNGRFKAPSLRNVAVRGTYMHDGRFSSLAQVVELYNSGIQANQNLDRILRDPNGNPQRLNMTQVEKDALVAFLGTLTDQTFLSDIRLSDPFTE